MRSHVLRNECNTYPKRATSTTFVFIDFLRQWLPEKHRLLSYVQIHSIYIGAERPRWSPAFPSCPLPASAEASRPAVELLPCVVAVRSLRPYSTLTPVHRPPNIHSCVLGWHERFACHTDRCSLRHWRPTVFSGDDGQSRDTWGTKEVCHLWCVSVRGRGQHR